MRLNRSRKTLLVEQLEPKRLLAGDYVHVVGGEEVAVVNVSTGDVQTIGRTVDGRGRLVETTDIAFDRAGELYAISPDGLYKVNPQTGELTDRTPLAQLHEDLSEPKGLAFNAAAQQTLFVIGEGKENGILGPTLYGFKEQTPPWVAGLEFQNVSNYADLAPNKQATTGLYLAESDGDLKRLTPFNDNWIVVDAGEIPVGVKGLSVASPDDPYDLYAMSGTEIYGIEVGGREDPALLADVSRTSDLGDILGTAYFGQPEMLAGSISGKVWHDTNGNEVHDPGEDPLVGWEVYLNPGGDDSKRSVTDEDGNFIIFGVEADRQQTVEIVVQEGWETTTSPSRRVTLADGGNQQDLDFGLNQAPIAVDDDLETEEDTPVEIDCLANDTDDGLPIDHRTVDVTVTQHPTNGRVDDDLDPDTGMLTYTPNTGFSGRDTFTYEVTDEPGNTSEAATVTILVKTDAKPTLDAIDSPIILREGDVTEVVALTGISDEDEHTVEDLIITATSDNTDVLPNPQIIYSSPQETADLILAPIQGAAGWAIIVVTVEEPDGDSVSRRFVVSVGNNPLVWQNPVDQFDVNDDGTVDRTDYDTVVDELNDRLYIINQEGELRIPPPPGGPPHFYDVDGDGRAIPFDLCLIRCRIIGCGDVNLDGVFNSSDMVKVLVAGEYEDDIPDNSTFEEGDWNGDQDFTSADLVHALQLDHYERAPAPQRATAAELGAALAEEADRLSHFGGTRDDVTNDLAEALVRSRNVKVDLVDREYSKPLSPDTKASYERSDDESSTSDSIALDALFSLGILQTHPQGYVTV